MRVEHWMARVGRRGVVTLPKPWRERYRIHEGAALTLVDLGGVFFLLPPSQLEPLAERGARGLQAQGLTLEEMLQVLRAARTEEMPGASQEAAG